jgi:hypothetical protein
MVKILFEEVEGQSQSARAPKSVGIGSALFLRWLDEGRKAFNAKDLREIQADTPAD